MTLEPHHFLHLKCDRLTSSADERGESIVGRAANSWRTAEAWVQGRRVDGLQVHDPTPRTAIADLADIPADRGISRSGSRAHRPSRVAGFDSEIRSSQEFPARSERIRRDTLRSPLSIAVGFLGCAGRAA